MLNRPTLWNGIEVPYGASVEELARWTDGPAPQRWAAFVALAHTPGDSALEPLRVPSQDTELGHANWRRCMADGRCWPTFAL
jgi:hypothetical protein